MDQKLSQAAPHYIRMRAWMVSIELIASNADVSETRNDAGCLCNSRRFGCSTAYTGLAIGVTDLVGNIYINNLIGGLVEAVAYCLSFVTAAKGRRKVYIPLLLIGGVSLVTNSVISSFLPGKYGNLNRVSTIT